MNTISIKNAKDDREFVGFKVKENDIQLSFPIGYDIQENEFNIENKEKIEEIKKDIKNLIKVLEENEDYYYDKGDIKFGFSSAIFIIENYLKYGMYTGNNELYNINGNGKIAWKETLNRIEPILSRNNYFYNNFYTIKKQTYETKITKIHKYCLNVSLKVLGWMYNIKHEEKINRPFDDDEMIYELTQELYKINEDRKKQILKEMIYFIKGTNSSKILNNNEFAIGRNYFDKVWEGILRKQIYKQYDEFECYPNTYYYSNKTGEKEYNSNLYPDIVIKKDKTIVIIDAKYYKAGQKPPSSDICKQIFYERYIQSNNRKYDIKNIFVLPKKLPNEKIEKYGYASAEGLENKSKIDVYYVNTKSVMENNEIIKQLIEKVLHKN